MKPPESDPGNAVALVRGGLDLRVILLCLHLPPLLVQALQILLHLRHRMNIGAIGAERSDDLAATVQPQNDFIAVGTSLDDLDQARDEHNHIANGIAFGEDRLPAREALLPRGRNNGVTVGGTDVREQCELCYCPALLS